MEDSTSSELPSSSKIKVAEPAASRELMHSTAYEWVTNWSMPAKEDPASRPCCKVCKVISENYDDLKVVAACKICVVKAAALNRIKSAGGEDDDDHSAKAAEDGKATSKPAGMVKASALAEKEVIKTVTREDGEGGMPETIVTVRVPYDDLRNVMRLPPRTPLRPLPADFFLRESGIGQRRKAARAGAAATLSSIETQENVLAQFFETGYATLDLEVVNG